MPTEYRRSHLPAGRIVAGIALLVLSQLWLFGTRNSYHPPQSMEYGVLSSAMTESWRWPIICVIAIMGLSLLVWEGAKYLDSHGWLGRTSH